MYHHPAPASQLITKYADFIQQNPDYIKKVIISDNSRRVRQGSSLTSSSSSSIRLSSAVSNYPTSPPPDTHSFPNVIKMEELEALGIDPDKYLIDTIKYTELYPGRRPSLTRRDSSGFSSGRSSATTTDSGLRKNLRAAAEPLSGRALPLDEPEDEEPEAKTKKTSETPYDKEAQRQPPTKSVPFEAAERFFADEPAEFIKPPPVEPLDEELRQIIAPPGTYDQGFLLSSGSEDEIDRAENDTSFLRDNSEEIEIPAPAAAVTSDPVPATQPQLKPFTKDSDKYFKKEIILQNSYENSPVHSTKGKGVATKTSPLPGYNIPIVEPLAAAAAIAAAPRFIPESKQNNLSFSPKRAPNVGAKGQKQFGATNNNPVPPPNIPQQVVRYQSILPTWSPPEVRRRVVARVPGILRRYNMDQWVAKIIWLYTNGDDRNPRVEYRFRPEKDVRSFDGLCDILSKRLALTRGVRYIYSLSGRPILNLEDLRHEHSYVVSSIKKFQALDYGHGAQMYDIKKFSSPVPPITNRVSLPPIRGRKTRSLRRRANSVSRSRSPAFRNQERQQQAAQYLSADAALETGRSSPGAIGNSAAGRLKKEGGVSRTEAQKLVDAVIGETHPVQRKVVRIINGEVPSIQSQVLLNTRVSQEWEDLVRDLSQAVKFPRHFPCHLETLVGRKILSYSQLRAELNAGNQTFYIYSNSEDRLLGKNSQTSIDALRNMKNLSLQDARKEVKTLMSNGNLPPPALKKTKDYISSKFNGYSPTDFEMPRQPEGKTGKRILAR